jgi:hypothetical protein
MFSTTAHRHNGKGAARGDRSLVSDVIFLYQLTYYLNLLSGSGIKTVYDCKYALKCADLDNEFNKFSGNHVPPDPKAGEGTNVVVTMNMKLNWYRLQMNLCMEARKRNIQFRYSEVLLQYRSNQVATVADSTSCCVNRAMTPDEYR